MHFFKRNMSKSYSDDVNSPEILVKTVYKVISGEKDVERNWERFRFLFLPSARLIISSVTKDGEEAFREFDVEQFITEAREFYKEKGFWENQVASKSTSFGNISHIFSLYESHVKIRESDPVGRGINSFQLVKKDGRWWIANIVWDIERDGNPIPDWLS